MGRPSSGTTIMLSEPRPPKRSAVRSAAWGCGAALLMLGCGDGSAENTTSTSTEDLAAFIEQNPEYGNAPPANGEPSDSNPLGLER